MSVVWVFVGIFMGLPFLMELFLSFLSLRWKPTFPAFRSSKRVKRLPFVSVLVPAYREPPDIVIRTLESLRKQSYPNYEVLVLVNNTPEVELWLPVKLYCSKVGKPFKFVYLENVKGYKAGVLNIAENYMDPRTEIIAVVDSDYVVKSDFISSAISYFLDPDVGVVQFPQDYRDFPNNPFFVAMYYSYRYFFAVIMKICDFLRATSFMGTVGFIRKSALIDAGRWDGKVLTEDSETGLRINAYGYKCIYLDKSVGKGLMPLDMVSLKTQRFRWAFGNMQTIVKHIGLLTLYRTLPFTKKVAFIVQNTVWHNPLVMVLILSFVSYFYRPIAISALTLTLLYFVSKSIIFLHVFRKADKLPFKDVLFAFIFYLALFVPMSLAPVCALLGVRVSFKRTPKSKEFLKDSSDLFEHLFLFLKIVFILVALYLKVWEVACAHFLYLSCPLSYMFVRYLEKKSMLLSSDDVGGGNFDEDRNYISDVEKGAA